MLFVLKLLMRKHFYAEASPKQRKVIHNKSNFDGRIVWSEITILVRDYYKLPSVRIC